MVPAAQGLSADEAYFIVMYEDPDLCIPVIQTLLFIESKIGADGKTSHYFRDLSASEESQRFRLHEEQVDHLLLNREQLMATLAECHLRARQISRSA